MNAAAPAADPTAARAAAVWAATATWFTAWALPGLHWHDTAEFAAAARRLSLSHSPGHPLHAVTTHAAQALIPVGDAALRANLASGLAIATACAVLYRLLRHAAPALPWLGAAAMAVTPALLPAIWLQGVRAEVYGLQLALTVALGAALWGVVARDGRALPATALIFGLAGANHSLIGAALLPTALLALAVGLRRLRPLLWALPAGALGLATYAYLILRATAGAEVGWGRPTTASALWATISAREWARNATSADVDLAENAARLAVYLVDQVGPVAALLLLMVLGLGALPAWRTRRAPFVGALLMAAGLFATRFFYVFDPLNPDLSGYFAGALVALLFAAWTALGALVASVRPQATWLAYAALLLLASRGPAFDPGHRAHSRRAEAYGHALLAEVPIGGALITSDYTSTFLAWGLRALEGARPDVAVIFRGQVHRPWFVARLATQAPAWAARLADFPAQVGTPSARFEPGVEADRLGALQPHLAPQGATLGPRTPPRLATPVAAFAPLDGPGADDDTARTVALHHAEHARHILTFRPAAEADLARWHLDRAQALAGPDPFILALRQRLPP